MASRSSSDLTGGAWIDVENLETVHARPGYDIVTTINLDLQDVAENALYRQLSKSNAHHGCVVVDGGAHR